MSQLKNMQERFLRMEEQEHFFDLKIFNIKIWPYIKYAVYKHFVNVYFNIDTTKFGYGDSRPLLKEYKKRYNIKKLIKNQEILVFTDPRRANIDGTYVSTHSDIVCEELSKNYRTLLIEDPFTIYNQGAPLLHFNPTKYQNIAYTDIVENCVAKKINKYKNSKKILSLKTDLDCLIKKILKHFYKLSEEFLYDVIIDRILYVKFAMPIFYKLIKSSKAKAAFLFYGPAQTKLISCDICRRLSIPIIELQHGIQTDSDPFFYQIENRNRQVDTYPDYIFSFGEKTLCSNRYPNKLAKNVIPIGYPFLDYRFSQLTKKSNNAQKIILFLSQKTIGMKVSLLAKELACLLRDKREYKIIYRLHPFELANFYPHLENIDNLLVIPNTNKDVYYYHNIAYCQVGCYSTALYEGLKFSLPTIILDNIFGSDITSDILNDVNGVYNVKSAKELYDLLTKSKLTAPTKEDVNKLWKENAIENLKFYLEKIINER